MDDLERIVRKGPDTKLVQRANSLMLGLSNSQEQLLVANLMRRYLTRWNELSSYYTEETGDLGRLWNDPYFSPSATFVMPKTLRAISMQALMKSRAMLADEALPEAIIEYEQVATAMKNLPQESFLARLKSALPGRHRQTYSLRSTRKEIDLVARIYLHT